MRLYGYWRSSSTWRVRIALAHKGLAYENVPVNLLLGAHRATPHTDRNALAQVPVLSLTIDGDPHLLTQSMAIIEALEELQPSPPLLPGTLADRAKARAFAEIVNSGVQPLQNLAVLQHVTGTLHGDRVAWSRKWIAQGLAAMEAVATAPGPWLVAGQLTVAEVFLVPQLYNARRFQLDLSAYPHLLAAEAAALALPSVQSSHPDRQPDAQ